MLAVGGLVGLTEDLRRGRPFVQREIVLRSADQLALAYLRGEAASTALAAGAAVCFDEIQRTTEPAALIVGHILGPLSCAALLCDEHGIPLAADAVLCESLLQHLQLRAVWQEQRLRTLGSPTLICVEEPFLASAANPFSPVDIGWALSVIADLCHGLRGACALDLRGTRLEAEYLALPVHVLIVDALDDDWMGDHATALAAFLARGGRLALGLVAASENAADTSNLHAVTARLVRVADTLGSAGMTGVQVAAQIWITSSGDAGALSVAGADGLLDTLAQVSRHAQAHLFPTDIV